MNGRIASPGRCDYSSSRSWHHFCAAWIILKSGGGLHEGGILFFSFFCFVFSSFSPTFEGNLTRVKETFHNLDQPGLPRRASILKRSTPSIICRKISGSFNFFCAPRSCWPPTRSRKHFDCRPSVVQSPLWIIFN